MRSAELAQLVVRAIRRTAQRAEPSLEGARALRLLAQLYAAAAELAVERVGAPPRVG